MPYGLVRLYKKHFSRSSKYKHKQYGKIYYPFYNLNTTLNNKYPDIYNKDGIKLELFFIRDIHSAHLVYSDSNYFQYDRYNFGLDTHFYTHNSMLETMGEPKRKYGMLLEAEIICPNDYLIFKKHPSLNSEFNLIFTYSDFILQNVPNSRYIPYYLKYSNFNTTVPNDIYLQKSKNISIIASGKEMVPLHKYRNSIARKCKTLNLADVYGTIDGGRYCDISEPFMDYRFSIAIENEITPYAFTEKITNCFQTMTIPVYYGAAKIDKLFNPDGIILLNQNDDIEQILKKCTKGYYDERIPAIIDNFNRVNINKTADDIMYENYIQKDIGKISPEDLINSLKY